MIVGACHQSRRSSPPPPASAAGAAAVAVGSAAAAVVAVGAAAPLPVVAVGSPAPVEAAVVAVGSAAVLPVVAVAADAAGVSASSSSPPHAASRAATTGALRPSAIDRFNTSRRLRCPESMSVRSRSSPSLNGWAPFAVQFPQHPARCRCVSYEPTNTNAPDGGFAIRTRRQSVVDPCQPVLSICLDVL